MKAIKDRQFGLAAADIYRLLYFRLLYLHIAYAAFHETTDSYSRKWKMPRVQNIYSFSQAKL